MANTAWCRICGKSYSVCPHCESVRRSTPWRIICDTAAHYQLWLVVQDYKNGVITKRTAKKSLKSLIEKNHISSEDFDGYIPAVANILNEILE